MTVNIRVAQREDCARLLELVHALALFEKAPEAVTIALSEFEEAGFGPQSVWKAFVAEVNGRIEGFALYYIRFSTWKGCRLYLEDLFVTEEMRGKGLGTLLFEAILKEAKDKNLKGLAFQALTWNAPAINFYKKYNATFDDEWYNIAVEL